MATEPTGNPNLEYEEGVAQTPTPGPVRPEFLPPSRRRRRRRKRRGARSGDLFLLLILFILGIVFFAYDFERIFQLLYNQTAGLVLVIIVVEYLILKSMDRTRVYEMENVRLREQRRSDRALMQKARNLLEERLEHDEKDPSEEEKARWKTRVDDLVDELGSRL